MSATLVRKSCVTATHNSKPELKQDLADLMCHSKGMAEKVYFLSKKSENAANTSSKLRRIMREEPDDTNEIVKCFKDEISNNKKSLSLASENIKAHQLHSTSILTFN